MIILSGVTLTEVDFIPQDEYVLSIDCNSSEVLLFAQNALNNIQIYNLKTKQKMEEISGARRTIISAKIFDKIQNLLLTPSFSCGEIIISSSKGKFKTIVPKINCNKGQLRSSGIYHSKLYYVFPNNIMHTNLEGGNPCNLVTSPQNMFIDTALLRNFSTTILLRRNIYYLELNQNQTEECVIPLQSGMIPRSIALTINESENILEAYILCMCKNKSFVIHYKFHINEFLS